MQNLNATQKKTAEDFKALLEKYAIVEFGWYDHSAISETGVSSDVAIDDFSFSLFEGEDGYLRLQVVDPQWYIFRAYLYQGDFRLLNSETEKLSVAKIKAAVEMMQEVLELDFMVTAE